MNGRKDVVFNQFFGEQNSVFKVVSVPRHEGDKNVFAEGEFAVFVAAPSAKTVPTLTAWPRLTTGFCVKHVQALERMNLRSS